jgi:hypothetical protein
MNAFRSLLPIVRRQRLREAPAIAALGPGGPGKADDGARTGTSTSVGMQAATPEQNQKPAPIYGHCPLPFGPNLPAHWAVPCFW